MRGKRVRRKTSLIRETLRLTKETQAVKDSVLNTKTQEFYLTEVDKITYAKGTDEKNIILEVVNVSYEIRIKDQWITILRYDSEHGFLHCHMRISLSDQEDAVTTAHVIKKGTPHEWLTWSINDVIRNYQRYRREFMKRSKLVDIDYE